MPEKHLRLAKSQHLCFISHKNKMRFSPISPKKLCVPHSYSEQYSRQVFTVIWLLLVGHYIKLLVGFILYQNQRIDILQSFHYYRRKSQLRPPLSCKPKIDKVSMHNSDNRHGTQNIVGCYSIPLRGCKTGEGKGIM